MLDTICILQYPTTTTLVEFHSVSGNFGYDSTFYNRAYYYAFAGYPSLFRDGKDIWSGSSPGDWRDSVNARRAKPSPITLTISGWYNSASDTGVINVSFRNDSTATISNSMVYFVITEDSLYNVDPNTHAWHNHMARTFLPYTSKGDTMTLAVGETKVKTRGFKIKPAWNENRCHIAVWYQSNSGIKDGFQSGHIKVTQLVPVQEQEPYPAPAEPLIALSANPCASSARFSLNLPDNSQYTIAIYDLTGRQVSTLSGVAAAKGSSATWDLRDRSGNRVPSGVYLFRLICGAGQETGSIVVR